MLELANLSSPSISVTTLFYSIATEFYHSIAFIIVTKFLCRDRDSAFNSLLCRNMSFFVSILFVLLFNSLLRQRIHLLHVLFVAIEILLLLVVNYECYVATGFSLLRQKFLLELAWF